MEIVRNGCHQQLTDDKTSLIQPAISWSGLKKRLVVTAFPGQWHSQRGAGGYAPAMPEKRCGTEDQ